MKNKTVVVVGTSITGNQITLYTEDGQSIFFEQLDPRIKSIMAGLNEKLMTEGKAIVTIPANRKNEYIKSIIMRLKDIKSKSEELTQAIIDFNFIVGDNKYNIDDEDLLDFAISDSKIEAVVNDVVVPDIDKLETYILNETQEVSGVAMLIKRLAEMNEKREHSSQDLVDFLKTAKLPITNKGNFIFLKAVYQEGDYYVDMYTRTIKQQVGSLVSMEVDMVDPDRNRDCSAGLHVASVEYASSFGGTAILVGIVRPEDVVAVPYYDNTKIRVCAYQVVGAEKTADFMEITTNHSIEGTSPEFKEFMQGLVEDKYPDPITFTHITKDNGIVYTNWIEDEVVLGVKGTKEVEVLKDKDPSTEITPEKDRIIPKKALTNKQQIHQNLSLLRTQNNLSNQIELAKNILVIKRRMKKGWEALGVEGAEAVWIEEIAKKSPF